MNAEQMEQERAAIARLRGLDYAMLSGPRAILADVEVVLRSLTQARAQQQAASAAPVVGETERVETNTGTVVLGNPPQSYPADWSDDDPRRHNCDAMGCGYAHVLARLPKTTPTVPADVMADAGRWQPIETAPKDATPVDIWRGGWHERATNMRRVELSPTNIFYEPIEAGPSCVRDATHWMPLPEAPVARAAEKGTT